MEGVIRATVMRFIGDVQSSLNFMSIFNPFVTVIKERITLCDLFDIGLTPNNIIRINHMINWKLKTMHIILHKLITKENVFLIITMTKMNHNLSPPSFSIILTLRLATHVVR